MRFIPISSQQNSAFEGANAASASSLLQMNERVNASRKVSPTSFHLSTEK
jgi:hypothetical protein